MIEVKHRSGQATSAQSPSVAITEREVKMVHYMSEDIVKKLTKNTRKNHQRLRQKKKRRLLLSVLQTMTVGRVDVDTECSEIAEWTELIDRGGLTYVNSEVNKLAILLIV